MKKKSKLIKFILTLLLSAIVTVFLCILLHEFGHVIVMLSAGDRSSTPPSSSTRNLSGIVRLFCLLKHRANRMPVNPSAALREQSLLRPRPSRQRAFQQEKHGNASPFDEYQVIWIIGT